MKIIISSAFFLAVLGLVACGGSSGPQSFMSVSSSGVAFIQWQPDSTGNGIQGTITADSVSWNPPDYKTESLSVNSYPVTGRINGSSVTLDLAGSTIYGTLSGSTLTLNSLNTSSGSIQASTFTQADTSAYNQAVAALRRKIRQANLVAAQAQAAQQRQQKDNQDLQTTQNDLATLQQDEGNFNGDLSALAGDVKQANSDLGTLKSDAAHGQGSYCDNVYNVGDDAYTVDDDSYILSDDLYTLVSDFQTVHQDTAAATADLQTLASVPAPAGVSSALSAAHTAIRQAKATANSDITQMNAIDRAAYSIANAMATGSCSGQGPGSPGGLVTHIH